MNDAITQELIINAPIQTVWRVVTQPMYVAQWFCDTAEYEPKVGSKGKVSWENLGVDGRNYAPFEVVTVDEPHAFAFLWVSPDKVTSDIEGETQVTFQLSEVDGGTQLRVTESGFDKLAIAEAAKREHMEGHVGGWQYFLGKIGDVATKA